MWEKQNPLRTEDRPTIVKRGTTCNGNLLYKFYELVLPVIYAYNQFLLCFGHCPDVWYEAALYLQRASDTRVCLITYSCIYLSLID